MKKRLFTLVLAMVLTMGLIPACALGLVRSAYVYTSDGRGLNVRPMPSTGMDPIGTVPYGAQVHINDYIENEWVEIDYGNLHGFVMGRYLSYDPPPSPYRPDPTYAPVPTYRPVPAPTQKPTQKPETASSSTSLKQIFSGFVFINYTVRVRPSTPGSFVHMRWAPTKAADPIRDYHQNDELLVIAQNNTWAQVVDPATGITGFMMRSFLTEFGVGSSGSVGGDS